MKRKIYLKTFGCQMNIYDSNRVLDMMKLEGYEEIEDINTGADLIFVNTCHIREKAEEKLFCELGRYTKLKESNPGLIVVVGGCVAQADRDLIHKRNKNVDIVIGPEAYHKLPELVRSTLSAEIRKKEVVVDFNPKKKFEDLPKDRLVRGVSEFITVQEGCDKFCTFCVVPYTRGREFSRPPEQIIEEAFILRDKGVREITLLGQNVDNYKGKDAQDKTHTLADIIYKVAEIDGIERIRYVTSYPSQAGDDLIQAHGDLEKLMPFMYLPAQSGSDEVLRNMNRRYTIEQYKNVVARLRLARPDIAMSSDFIVGFPGETEEHFQETIELAKDIGFATSFSFKYSPRPGTPGAKMEQIDESVKQNRLERLQVVLDQQQKHFNTGTIGKTMSVLVEGISERDENVLFGRSQYLQATFFNHSHSNPKSLIGTIQRVRVNDGGLRALNGEMIS